MLWITGRPTVAGPRTVAIRHVRVLLAMALAVALGGASSADAYVYWANSKATAAQTNAIGRAKLDGSSANQVFVTTSSVAPGGVAVDARYIYWTAGFSIGRANLDGSGANPNFIPRAGVPRAVAVDAHSIYWTSSSSITGDTIGRANLDGSGANVSFITGASSPMGVAVNGTGIYWANYGTSTIGAARLDGGGANQSVVAGGTSLDGVAVDGGYVYWANGGQAGKIGRAKLDGSGANPSFITGANAPHGVAVDGGHIYWANGGDNRIGRANLDGSGANPRFIEGASGPRGVAVDALGASPVKFTATCTVRRAGSRTRIACRVKPAPGKAAKARLIRRGKTIASGQLTAAGAVAFTVARRPGTGTYQLAFGKTTIKVRLR